jgi:hypothetical protein
MCLIEWWHHTVDSDGSFIWYRDVRVYLQLDIHDKDLYTSYGPNYRRNT